MVKSGDRETLAFLILHFAPLQGWISDKKADLLLSLGEDEAIAVSARLTHRQRAGVTGEAELAGACLSHGQQRVAPGSNLGFLCPSHQGSRHHPAPAQPADQHP